jgi:small-conductance mechanosensitive channel
LVTITERHGVVSDIRARYTVVRGLDGTEAIIPNDSIISNMVLNHSYSDRVVAIKTQVSISYQSDTERAMEILLATGKSQARVLATPEPTVWIKNLGDNGIELELTTWIHDAEQGQGSLRSDIFVAVLSAFRAAGVEIPYPRREIRLLSGGKEGDSPRPASA